MLVCLAWSEILGVGEPVSESQTGLWSGREGVADLVNTALSVPRGTPTGLGRALETIEVCV